MQSKGRPGDGFESLLEGQQELICRFHRHELQAHQCGSILLQQIKVPVATVWSILRRFDKPQVYKRFIQTCDIVEGDGSVGTVREVHLVSSIPATSSVERLEILDEVEHIISFRVLGGGHRLQNYWSVTSLHPHEIDGEIGTLVLESYVVDIPEGNTREETHMFVDTVVRCNLKALAQVSQRKFFHEQSQPPSAAPVVEAVRTAPEVVKRAHEVVKTAPEVVKPAPEVVRPAPEVVRPAPEVVRTAPEVVQE